MEIGERGFMSLVFPVIGSMGGAPRLSCPCGKEVIRLGVKGSGPSSWHFAPSDWGTVPPLIQSLWACLSKAGVGGISGAHADSWPQLSFYLLGP